MAVIFVDYENVSLSGGLRGAEYLNAQDRLLVFYSEVCGKIRNIDYEKIKKAKCDFKIHKLINPGKNALDFYIATRVGMEYQKGERQLVIVSKDKGFSAVRDFINAIPCTVNRKIVQSPNIEQGLLMLSDVGNEYRRNVIAENNGLRDITEAQAYIQARIEMRNAIEDALMGTRFEKESSKIIDFVDSDMKPSKKKIYTSAMHEYGLRDGVELYRIIKEVV